MHGLDAKKLAKDIKGDEFAVQACQGEGQALRDH